MVARMLQAMYYLGWRQHAVDPCLFIKYTKEGKLMMFLLWVDDCFITGPEKNVNEEAEAFERLFTITDEIQTTFCTSTSDAKLIVLRSTSS